MNLIRSVNRYGAYMLFNLEKVVLAPISDDADKPDGLDVQSESALPFVSTILNFTISNKQWIDSAVCVTFSHDFLGLLSKP